MFLGLYGMEILLDTHAFMWFVNDDPMLGKAAKEAIEERGLAA